MINTYPGLKNPQAREERLPKPGPPHNRTDSVARLTDALPTCDPHNICVVHRPNIYNHVDHITSSVVGGWQSPSEASPDTTATTR